MSDGSPWFILNVSRRGWASEKSWISDIFADCVMTLELTLEYAIAYMYYVCDYALYYKYSCIVAYPTGFSRYWEICTKLKSVFEAEMKWCIHIIIDAAMVEKC